MKPKRLIDELRSIKCIVPNHHDGFKAEGRSANGIPCSRLHSLCKLRSSIPHRQPRLDLCSTHCTGLRTCRFKALWQLLAGTTIIFAAFQTLSCGLFYSAGSAGSRGSYSDFSSLTTAFLSSDLGSVPSATKFSTSHFSAGPANKRIPRIIHQTYHSSLIPEHVQPMMQTWRQLNPEATWEIRFYDDDACSAFVAKEFPEYLAAYQALPKNVERSDFFRYMVVLRHGGVYADVDVECRTPLDSFICPNDTLLAGWENEVSDDAQAFKRHFARKRQVLQWFFAAAPGHPVLRNVCDHIAGTIGRVFSSHPNRDTLDRTGPGAWTDAVLHHAVGLPREQAAWPVRILPRVAFGVNPDLDNLSVDSPGVLVLHRFLGTWKEKGGWQKRPSFLRRALKLIQRLTADAVPEEPIRSSHVSRYPVSTTSFEAPFTVLVDLVGQGDRQAGVDVSSVITTWGRYEAAFDASRQPSAVGLVVEALRQHSGSSGGRGQAGSEGSTSSGNGLDGNHVTTDRSDERGRYQAVGVGSGSSNGSKGIYMQGVRGSQGAEHVGATFVDAGAGLGFFSLAAAAGGHRVISFEASPTGLATFNASVHYNNFEHLVTLHRAVVGAAAEPHVCTGHSSASSTATEAPYSDLQQGYGSTRTHGHGSLCPAGPPRVTLSGALAGTDMASIGALRISASGWEGFVLDGAMGFLSAHRPLVILLEFFPALLQRAGDRRSPAAILQVLYDLGYSRIAHAGHACEARWAAAQHGSGGHGRHRLWSQEAKGTPHWCNLRQEHFEVLGRQRLHPQIPENVMLYHDRYHSGAASSGP